MQSVAHHANELHKQCSNAQQALANLAVNTTDHVDHSDQDTT